eukprot:CAMPEP_0184551890 /NCGR_PEP_ID=MMETSP0199_2-20130426/26945_1 /TAXON_ID=1112570 /ORGANISM="Thraustochytrium sp., Strain LLF1b" /LENGTH=609 /DNA_ID=CAMNT_0026947207 /DNA_START=22 /DNA_END=1851 /DNA_ORIENTATION=-
MTPKPREYESSVNNLDETSDNSSETDEDEDEDEDEDGDENDDSGKEGFNKSRGEKKPTFAKQVRSGSSGGHGEQIYKHLRDENLASQPTTLKASKRPRRDDQAQSRADKLYQVLTSAEALTAVNKKKEQHRISHDTDRRDNMKSIDLDGSSELTETVQRTTSEESPKNATSSRPASPSSTNGDTKSSLGESHPHSIKTGEDKESWSREEMEAHRAEVERSEDSKSNTSKGKTCSTSNTGIAYSRGITPDLLNEYSTRKGSDGSLQVHLGVIESTDLYHTLQQKHPSSSLTPAQYRTSVRLIVEKNNNERLIPEVRQTLSKRISSIGKRAWGFQQKLKQKRVVDTARLSTLHTPALLQQNCLTFTPQSFQPDVLNVLQSSKLFPGGDRGLNESALASLGFESQSQPHLPNIGPTLAHANFVGVFQPQDIVKGQQQQLNELLNARLKQVQQTSDANIDDPIAQVLQSISTPGQTIPEASMIPQSLKDRLLQIHQSQSELRRSAERLIIEVQHKLEAVASEREKVEKEVRLAVTRSCENKHLQRIQQHLLPFHYQNLQSSYLDTPTTRPLPAASVSQFQAPGDSGGQTLVPEGSLDPRIIRHFLNQQNFPPT